MNASELRRMKTIHTGQCCDLKVETATRRHWLCNGDDTLVSEERLVNGRWEMVVDHKQVEG